MGLSLRAIRPFSSSFDEEPNGNDPASVPPATVGPPAATPGDPSGVVVQGGPDLPAGVPPRIAPSAWSGWPAEWNTPLWNGAAVLADIAWACIDLNSSVLSTMPPYLVGAAPTLDAGWLVNPNPDVYSSFEEFAKQLFWDYMACGETFVLATARYSTGWPSRFHVVAPPYVQVELDPAGLRRYTIGDQDVTADMLHLRYQSSVGDAHGHGPLDAAGARVTAANVLMRYATQLASSGGIPPSILKHEDRLSDDQALALKSQWVQARASAIGEPAVLDGGVTWEPVQLDPEKMALVELAQFNEARIAVILGVPPFLMGLPSGGDSMTYSNVTSLFDYHWRSGLRPKAQTVMAGLSGWLLPRGTSVELNRDAYVQPPPLERAQTFQILNAIIDKAGNPAMTVAEFRQAERLDDVSPANLAEGVFG